MPRPAELQPWLEQMWESGKFSNFGPLCQRFEEEVAALLDPDGQVKVATAANGTAALELALGALRLRTGAKVLVPSLTFAATALAVSRTGLVPVFADVDDATWMLNPEIARRACRLREVEAVMPVAVFGRPVDVEAWDAFTRACGIPVVVDAAGAFGDQRVGATTTVVFSFHATKALAIGEGGAIASRDAAFVDRARTSSNFGFVGEGIVEMPGCNGKLSEYHAAVGLAALRNWPAQYRRRQELAACYAETLARLGSRARLPDDHWPWIRSKLVVRIESGVTPRLLAGLARSAIETRRWYFPPLHRHPAFTHVERAEKLAVTDRLAGQLLGLPFHLDLQPADVERVVRALEESLA